MRLISAITFLGFSVPAFAALTESTCPNYAGVWDATKGACNCESNGSVIESEKEGEACKASYSSDVCSIIFTPDTGVGCETANVYNTNLSCPKSLLRQMSLNNKTGFLGINPNEQCVHSTEKTFQTPAQLEKYFANSDAYSLDADPTLLSASCLQHFSAFETQGNAQPASNEIGKEAVTNYYMLMNRLKQGSRANLESIAAIDSLLGKPLLHDVQFTDPHQAKVHEWMDQFQKKGCKPQGGVDQLSQDTFQQLQNIRSIENAIDAVTAQEALGSCTRNGCIRMPTDAEKAQIANYRKAIQKLEALYPWLAGDAFKKSLSSQGYGPDLQITQTFGSPTQTPQDAVANALKNQLQQNRDQALKELGDFKRASKCLNTQVFQYSECKDLGEVIAKTPPIELSTGPSTVTNAQSRSADSAMQHAGCEWDIEGDKEQALDLFTDTTFQIGLTIATASVSSMALGAKAAVTAVDAAKGGKTAVSALRAMRLMAATDAAFAAKGLKNASAACLNTFTKFDKAISSASTSNSPSCPAQTDAKDAVGRTAITDDTRNCATETIMAAVNLLPVVPAVRSELNLLSRDHPPTLPPPASAPAVVQSAHGAPVTPATVEVRRDPAATVTSPSTPRISPQLSTPKRWSDYYIVSAGWNREIPKDASAEFATEWKKIDQQSSELKTVLNTNDNPQKVFAVERAQAEIDRMSANSSSTVRRADENVTAQNWSRAREEVTNWSNQKEPLTLEKIMALHKTLLEGSKDAASNHPGQFRTEALIAARDLDKLYLNHEEIPQAMSDFMIWYHANENTMPPVELAGRSFQRLLTIHPFDDANGRVSRLIMEYILKEHGLPVPTFPNSMDMTLAIFPNEVKKQIAPVSPQQAVQVVTQGIQNTLNIYKRYGVIP